MLEPIAIDFTARIKKCDYLDGSQNKASALLHGLSTNWGRASLLMIEGKQPSPASWEDTHLKSNNYTVNKTKNKACVAALEIKACEIGISELMVK